MDIDLLLSTLRSYDEHRLRRSIYTQYKPSLIFKESKTMISAGRFVRLIEYDGHVFDAESVICVTEPVKEEISAYCSNFTVNILFNSGHTIICHLDVPNKINHFTSVMVEREYRKLICTIWPNKEIQNKIPKDDEQ